MKISLSNTSNPSLALIPYEAPESILQKSLQRFHQRQTSTETVNRSCTTIKLYKSPESIIQESIERYNKRAKEETATTENISFNVFSKKLIEPIKQIQGNLDLGKKRLHEDELRNDTTTKTNNVWTQQKYPAENAESQSDPSPLNIFNKIEQSVQNNNPKKTNFELLNVFSFDPKYNLDISKNLKNSNISHIPIFNKFNEDEIAETSQSSASFTIATDKKPIVATYGCGSCVALGGYDEANKIAFVVKFLSASEVRNSGALIYYNIAKLVKTKIEKPIQLHLRGGYKHQSEPIIEAIKSWMKQRDDLPMEIASEDILVSYEMLEGKSLSIDSRNGKVSSYNPHLNPSNSGISKLIINASRHQIRVSYSPK